tara:strand:- start:13226 stop:14098 length:873 start_codon:yes stop_codon:yes gene_type:complete
MVENLKKNEKFNVIGSNRQDTNLFNLEETKAIIKKIQPEVVINAAAKVGGIYANNTKRADFIIDNLKINLNILESVIEFNEIKVINLGSSCIYPLNAENPIKESEFMTGSLEPTNSPYAMAKLSSIEIGRSLKSQYGHEVINLMPTNLYGPNDNFDENSSHVIPGLIRRMHNAKINNIGTFEIWGTGKPLREFLFVDDLVNAVEFILTNNIKEDLINIGSGVEISILKLAELIKDVIGYKGILEFNTSMPDGNPRKLLDCSLINSLGWRHSTELEPGLIKTYDWFKNNIV